MKLLLAFLCVAISGIVSAQSIGIGTNSPNSSAQLDVVSTTKGLLIPRMTAAQRTAIASPANGLLVYETTTNSFWYYNSSVWNQIGTGGASLWTVNGTNIYNSNTGSVGIGTSTPNANAILDISSTTKGMLLPRMTTTQRNALTGIEGMAVYDTDFKEFYHHDGTSWRKLLNSNFWNSSSTRSWIYNSGDSIGIGTSSPDQKLHLLSGKFYIQDNRANQSPHVIFDNPSTDYKEGGLQWHRSGDTLASLDYVEHPLYPNYLRFTAGNTSSMYFNSIGHLGLGYSDPQTKLHLRDANAADDMIRIDGINPTIRFMKRAGGPVYTWSEVGFVQTTDNMDLRIGTYSGNTTGKFIIRTDGTDRVHVTGVGMGIGTNLPLTNLHLVGGQDAGLTVNNNGYAMIGSATSNGTNLVIDNNEIIARTGYSTAGTLFLQNNGGSVTVGANTTINAAATINGSTTINNSGEALKINGTGTAINFYEGGSFKSFIQHSSTGLYLGVNNGNIRLDMTNGHVAIGTVVLQGADAAAYKLAVNGKIVCEELRVKLDGNWPDYVFNSDYKLLPLNELRNYIAANNHLPNIPSAAVVEKEGIQVGDMQKRLMEKVEELTLYILDLQQQIEELKKEKK